MLLEISVFSIKNKGHSLGSICIYFRNKILFEHCQAKAKAIHLEIFTIFSESKCSFFSSKTKAILFEYCTLIPERKLPAFSIKNKGYSLVNSYVYFRNKVFFQHFQSKAKAMLFEIFDTFLELKFSVFSIEN